jgi:hypothetical protein
MPDRLFLVESAPKIVVDRRVGVLIGWEEDPPRGDDEYCSECDQFLGEERARNILVPGFSDMRDLDPAQRVFFPGDWTPPFVFHSNHAAILGELLSGTQLVKVGYSEWDQGPVSKKQRLGLSPQFGALWVTAICKRAIDRKSGKELPRCASCGLYLGYMLLGDKRGRDIRPDRAAWSGEDAFLIPGFSKQEMVFLTQVGREKLDGLGFKNLRYTQVGWC